ncbi:MAG: tyrosine-type recombinase/integrase [Candidatus Solibacter sp.]|jgi:integrase
MEPSPTPTIQAKPAGTGTTIERAIAAYMAEHEKHSASQTVKRYGYLMEKVRRYSEHRGYTQIDQWSVSDVREFSDSWGVSIPTANRDMSVIRAFFGLCLDNEWIERNPAAKVKNPKGRSAGDGRGEQKLPFTDAELQRMYDACETKYGKMEIKWDKTTHHHAAEGVVNSYRYSWTGKDLADFISISTYTGLRISDASTFHIDRLKPNGEVTIRTTKSGTTVNTWIPEWLQAVIRRRSLEVGPLIFGQHDTKDLNVVTDIWRRKLKRLWSLCGPWKDKPTPHRFRHTFARILLERPGVTVRDVAELLGNSEAMVIRHYSAWIPSRQERLTEILRSAFAETPRPANVVQMPTAASK